MDVDTLYRELLRNTRDRDWHWRTPSGLWHCIRIYKADHLDMNLAADDRIMCKTDHQKWVVEKWIKAT